MNTYYIYKENWNNPIKNEPELLKIHGDISADLAIQLFMCTIESKEDCFISCHDGFLGWLSYTSEKHKDELHEINVDLFKTAKINSQLEFCGYMLTNYKLEI